MENGTTNRNVLWRITTFDEDGKNMKFDGSDRIRLIRVNWEGVI